MNKMIQTKIPFPELPMPAKYSKIRIKRENKQTSVETRKIPTIGIKQQRPKEVILKINIPETETRKLEPEPPTKHDHGNHVVHELDIQDYQ